MRETAKPRSKGEETMQPQSRHHLVLAVAWTPIATLIECADADQPQTNSTAGQAHILVSQPTGIWQREVGEGFRSSVKTLSLEAGASGGVHAFGGRQYHDLALLSLSYGHMLGSVRGEDHWYRGNWEGRAELFGGSQFSPRDDPLIGLAPHLRYNFATGTRWVPFADIGAGVTASGIGPPDQSGTFEFNLQGNIGTHWFVRDNVALAFETGLLQMSCAGIHDPNLGVHTIKGMLGITWFL
jgi:lipid A 3-O-deacylase